MSIQPRSIIYLMGAALLCSMAVGSVLTGTTEAKVKTGGTLVLYEAEGYSRAVAKAFTKETGIQVKIVHLPTGSLIAKIEAEQSNPKWDVFWSDGAATMQGLDDAGLLHKHFTPNNVKNYTSLGKSLIPSDRAYYPTGVTAAAAIAYNTKVVPANKAPKSWADLLTPYYKNAVAINNPSISGPAFPFLAGILQQMGVKNGKAYFEKLKANGVKIFPKNGPTLQALLMGQAKACVIQDAALIQSQVAGNPIRIVYPKSGTFMMPGVIAIDHKAPNLAAAKMFVNFVLSTQAQKVMVNPKNGAGDSYFHPIIKGIVENSARHDKRVHWVHINVLQAAKNENAWLNWFTNYIVQ